LCATAGDGGERVLLLLVVVSTALVGRVHRHLFAGARWQHVRDVAIGAMVETCDGTSRGSSAVLQIHNYLPSEKTLNSLVGGDALSPLRCSWRLYIAGDMSLFSLSPVMNSSSSVGTLLLHHRSLHFQNNLHSRSIDEQRSVVKSVGGAVGRSARRCAGYKAHTVLFICQCDG
jgi:hypothetical protein